MYYFLRFGYEGYKFSGFQRGNGNNSVEDSILKVLKENSLASDISCAARTDRGVSATGNVLKLSSDESAVKIAGILNSHCEGIFVSAYAEVKEDANPRHCLRKTYSYFLRDTPDTTLLSSQLSLFAGTHDFHLFCRRDSRNPVRTIERIDVIRTGEKTVRVDFTARSFVWMQIRNIMGFSIENASRGRLIDPFQVNSWSRKPASPLPLVLTDISYQSIEFTNVYSGSKEKYYTRAVEEQWSRYMITEHIVTELGRSHIYR
ncbi:MAG: hypothetical protein AAE983_07015 [Thermoplasmataceae archaeon]